jgi:hypothetical protein
MRKTLAVMLIGGSLAANAATAFAAGASERESTDGTRFIAQRIMNVPVSSATGNVQPAASTSTLPVTHNHDRQN